MPKRRKTTKSTGERKLAKLLHYLLPSHTVRSQFHVGSQMLLDFFIDELNLGIEYDGIQHYQYTPAFHKDVNDFRRAQQRDRYKETLCYNLGINLIRIKYDEDMESGEVVNRILDAVPGPGSKKLEAAKKTNGISGKKPFLKHTKKCSDEYKEKLRLYNKTKWAKQKEKIKAYRKHRRSK